MHVAQFISQNADRNHPAPAVRLIRMDGIRKQLRAHYVDLEMNHESHAFDDALREALAEELGLSEERARLPLCSQTGWRDGSTRKGLRAF